MPQLSILSLLIPRFLAMRNGWRRQDRHGRLRALVLATLMLLFWGGAFWFFHRVLGHFHTVPDLGLVLSQKLLNMVLLTFFAVLLFSNTIAGLSTLFLSRDLLLLVPAPVPPERLFLAKFVETMVDSSWMVLLFSVPAFLAFGVVHGGGLAYYLMTLGMLVPFLVIPAALGVLVTMVLAYGLPAQRGKDMLVIFSALFLALLYLLFRLLQPEKLVNPEAFTDFLAFLAAMRAPSAPFLPSTWASEALLPFLGIKTGEPWFYFCMLLSTALFLLVLGSWAATTLYPTGWSKAQEGRRRGGTRRWLHHLSQGLASLFPPRLRPIVVKDLKIFCRDTGQWSQLFQLLALVVVYIYNFSVLPQVSAENVYAFFNLALAGFVIAAIAVRFVFPALSLEGKTLWVLKSAPLHLRRWWWSKFWVNLFPLVLFGELLVVVTNAYLQVSSFMLILAPTTLFFLTFGIVALGLAVGVAYPNFTAEHQAKIAASYGGVLYMVLSILFIGLVVVLEARPVHILLTRRLHHIPLSAMDWGTVGFFFALALAVALGVFWGAACWSIKRLEALEISL
jgi:ABC-2 type transport system permease protein